MRFLSVSSSTHKIVGSSSFSIAARAELLSGVDLIYETSLAHLSRSKTPVNIYIAPSTMPHAALQPRAAIAIVLIPASPSVRAIFKVLVIVRTIINPNIIQSFCTTNILNNRYYDYHNRDIFGQNTYGQNTYGQNTSITSRFQMA